jgi:selenocysteine lyase/cysteine desulfurase
MTDVLALRSRLPLLDERTYFASQSYGPLPRDVRQDLDAYIASLHLRNRAIGPWIERMIETTTEIEALLGAPPGSVGLHGSATAAQATIAACLEPHGQRRRIIVSSLDFHSSRYLWAAQARRGFEIVEVTPADGRGFQPDELDGVIDERVAAVALALVSPRTGALLDGLRVATAARRAGALLVVDAFQALGVVPIDVRLLDPDVLVGGLYKWMSGAAPGLAFAYVRPRLAETLQPAYPGWIGHRDIASFAAVYEPAPGGARFQQGAPAIEPIYTARAGLRFVRDARVDDLRARSAILTQRVIERALEHGLAIVTPRPEPLRGPFVCFPMDDGVADAAVRALAEQRIDVDTRRGMGLRVGPHPCCTEEECDRVVDALALALAGRGA